MGPLTCEQAVRQFFAYLDRALAGEPLQDLEAHLEACLDCCDKLGFSRQLDAFFKERLPDSPMPTALETRIREALRRPWAKRAMAYFTVDQAHSIIRDTYTAAAADMPAVAIGLYAADELAGLPRGAVSLALGVGHPVRHARLRPGDVVLDVGCGAGIDTLLAAQAVGPRGRVIGLDMTPVMVERTRRHAAEAGLDNVEVREGLMEALPLGDASVDVVVSNGVLNLSTRKSRALAEMLRVLRAGGRLALADLVVTQALPEEVLRSAPALAGWLAGTLAEPVLTKKVANIGFEVVATVDRRPFGIGALAAYPVFPPEFVAFLRRVVPADRHDELVWSVVVLARKPEGTGGAHAG